MRADMRVCVFGGGVNVIADLPMPLSNGLL